METQTQNQAVVALNALASDPELLGEFILESREHLTAIEGQLLTLEQDPASSEAIHAIFRGFHTMKGAAAFLELLELQQVAHEVETVLDRARNSELAMTPAVVDGILLGKDYLSDCLIALEQVLSTGAFPALPANSELITGIRKLTAPVSPPSSGADCEGEEDPVAPALRELNTAVASGPATEVVSGGTSKAEGRLVKVDTTKLDFLVDMVGELVVAQSLVRHDPELDLQVKPRLARSLSQLARITEEVQKTAMSMRMVPVAQLFRKMGRLVRDLSKKTGKLVELELIGEETELDRNIVEELTDPLMHMVRNSIDHGIELPSDRERAGKPATARVTLSAGHQAGQIVIRVSDNGRGLDRGRIVAKAIQSGLITGGEVTDAEVFHLIFRPGFSTAERVTDVSGRGVGMDVVNRHIQKLRGRIDIDSTPGQGTTFVLKLPLTLAIIDGLVVMVGEERYIVPIYGVREMLRPSEDMISTLQGRSEMALVRGGLLPVVRLHERFGVSPRSVDAWEGLLIVAESNNKRFCLLVDQLVGKQEVVIKSLGPTLQGIRGVAGGAILGDGRVGLILDLEGLYAPQCAA